MQDDEDDELLVVNWQAPAARPFYVATPADPHNVTLRRRFRTEGRRLLDLSDEALDGSGSILGGDVLLDELERSRAPHMRDIVATIQADQYRLITRAPGPTPRHPGRPGTGKTAVGLHRASYLLYSHREQLRRVLVVGPNPTFMEYVSHVLPTLGEESVEQRAVAELVEGIEATAVDEPAVERLKGDVRLADILARAAAERSAPRPEELVARLEGEYVRVRERVVGELLERARDRPRPHGAGARAVQDGRPPPLLRGLRGAARRARVARLRRGRARPQRERVPDALARPGLATAAPDALVRSLLTTPARLAEAAEGILDATEQRLLRRSRAGFAWSEHDVALGRRGARRCSRRHPDSSAT